MSRSLTLGCVLLVMACFAANSVVTRYLVGSGLLSPAGVTLARFIAGAIMLAAILIGQGRGREARPRMADAGLVFFLGAYALAIAYGYRHITAAAGTFVFYALVILTMALGGGRPSGRALAGALTALAGVGLLAFGKVKGTTPLGVGLLAFTGATWGAYSLWLRKRGTPLVTNARAFIGFALFLPLLAWVERDSLAWTWPGLALGLGMGGFTTALSYALWAKVLPSLTPLEAGTFQLLVPLLTAFAGIGLLGEPFTPQLAVAGALVLGGMWLTSARR
jgi:drug/metabolite transporter (DMT)-like permease